MNQSIEIDQVMSGAIRLSINSRFTLLTRQQVGDLRLSVRQFPDFDLEAFVNYYDCEPEYCQFA